MTHPGVPEQDSYDEKDQGEESADYSSPADLRDPVVEEDAKAKGDSVDYGDGDGDDSRHAAAPAGSKQAEKKAAPPAKS